MTSCACLPTPIRIPTAASRRLTVVSSPKKPVKVRRTLGGWRHPLALALLLGAIAWAVGAFFATSDKDFPNVGTVPGISAIGGWNWAIAIVLGFVATSIADRSEIRRPAAGVKPCRDRSASAR